MTYRSPRYLLIEPMCETCCNVQPRQVRFTVPNGNIFELSSIVTNTETKILNRKGSRNDDMQHYLHTRLLGVPDH